MKATLASVSIVMLLVEPGTAFQQVATEARAAGPNAEVRVDPASGTPLPDDYVIGPDDVLSVVFWREKDMSAQVRVRSDGRISLPLLNDVTAVGLTPQQLRAVVNREAKRLVEDPDVTVVVQEINSRRVFVTGQVARAGAFPLVSPMTVLQAIALAGGLLEYADAENITIVRVANGQTTRLRFNYKDLTKGRNLEQNVPLKPGDTVVVP